MEYKKEVRNFYNQHALEQWLKYGILYGKDPISQLYDRREYEVIFKEFLRNISIENKLVLDVACGPGRWILRYLEKKVQLVAIDLSINALVVAKKNAIKNKLNPNFVCCDAEFLPFINGSFDVVNCIDALVARPEGPEKSISEIVRVLKIYSIAIIEPSNLFSFIAPLWWLRNLYRRIRRKLGLKIDYPTGVWLFPWQIKKIIKGQGLSIKKIRSIGIILPISNKLLKFCIIIDKKMSQKNIFKWSGSRILILAIKTSINARTSVLGDDLECGFRKGAYEIGNKDIRRNDL